MGFLPGQKGKPESIEQREKYKIIVMCIRDGRPVPRGTHPAGRGGFPAPPRTAGKGGFPAPPRKNDQNHGEVAGQNKGIED